MNQNSNQKSPHKSRSGIRRIWDALHYSLAGLRSAFAHEMAFRQEVILAVVLVATAIVMPTTGTQSTLLITSVLIVLIVELLNSAVEATVDRISVDDHELAKRAKDFGSAAVFVSLVNCLVTWALVLTELFAPG